MPRATRAKPAARPAAKAPGEDRRGDLLAAAYALIAEKGLEGLRTRDIAARAGVNISTLHYYFGTKEALIVAVVEYVRDRFTGANAQREAHALGTTPTLRSHLDGAWKSFQTTPHLAVVLQELVLRGQRDPSARAAFRVLHDFWNAMVEEVLRAGMARGDLRADLDPRAGARIVTSCIVGAMVQLGVNPKAFDFGVVARELERLVERAPE